MASCKNIVMLGFQRTPGQLHAAAAAAGAEERVQLLVHDSTSNLGQADIV